MCEDVISEIIPFYCFKTVLSDSVYIVSKTAYLIKLLVKIEKRKNLFM